MTNCVYGPAQSTLLQTWRTNTRQQERTDARSSASLLALPIAVSRTCNSNSSLLVVQHQSCETLRDEEHASFAPTMTYGSFKAG